MDPLGFCGRTDAEESAKQSDDVTTSDSDSDDTSGSDDGSLDSAEQRARQAAAKLRDYGDAAEDTSSALPFSASAAFSEVAGPPAFLDPEATRPLATSNTHGLIATPSAPEGGVPGHRGQKPKAVPGKDFDISVLAPPLKGEKRAHNSLGLPEGSVIEAKAKKNKMADIGPQYTAAQIAMLGGNVDEKGLPSKAQEVSEFLSKGVGGALLPRQQQDRKDKEKKKRALGQSSIGSWKSEAEMALRQQFDS